jgi:hypothetical protein
MARGKPIPGTAASGVRACRRGGSRTSTAGGRGRPTAGRGGPTSRGAGRSTTVAGRICRRGAGRGSPARRGGRRGCDGARTEATSAGRRSRRSVAWGSTATSSYATTTSARRTSAIATSLGIGCRGRFASTGATIPAGRTAARSSACRATPCASCRIVPARAWPLGSASATDTRGVPSAIRSIVATTSAVRVRIVRLDAGNPIVRPAADGSQTALRLADGTIPIAPRPVKRSCPTLRRTVIASAPLAAACAARNVRVPSARSDRGLWGRVARARPGFAPARETIVPAAISAG